MKRLSLRVSLSLLILPLLFTGCTTLQRFFDETADTVREFTGSGTKNVNTFDGEVNREQLDTSVVAIYVNDQKAIPGDKPGVYKITDPVPHPAIMRFEIEDAEALGDFQHAALNISRTTGGKSKEQYTYTLSEKKGRGTTLTAGTEVDLNDPDQGKYLILNQGKRIRGDHPVWHHGIFWYDMINDFEVECMVNLTVYSVKVNDGKKQHYQVDQSAAFVLVREEK
jgi:hypothetical protein